MGSDYRALMAQRAQIERENFIGDYRTNAEKLSFIKASSMIKRIWERAIGPAIIIGSLNGVLIAINALCFINNWSNYSNNKYYARLNDETSNKLQKEREDFHQEQDARDKLRSWTDEELRRRYLGERESDDISIVRELMTPINNSKSK